MEATHLPGAYEEETEALRFLDEMGPCRVSVSCCFTIGLGAGRDLEHGAEPAVWPQSQERKEGLAHRALAGVRGLV